MNYRENIEDFLESGILSLSKLSELSGVSRKTIYKILEGHTPKPVTWERINTIIKKAKKLGV